MSRYLKLNFFVKLLVRPIDKDLNAETRYKAALLEAQQENNLKLIAELNANYSNTPPTVNQENF